MADTISLSVQTQFVTIKPSLIYYYLVIVENKKFTYKFSNTLLQIKNKIKIISGQRLRSVFFHEMCGTTDNHRLFSDKTQNKCY